MTAFTERFLHHEGLIHRTLDRETPVVSASFPRIFQAFAAARRRSPPRDRSAGGETRWCTACLVADMALRYLVSGLGVLAVVFGVASAGCGGDEAPDTTDTDDVVAGRKTILTDKDDGRTIPIKEGQSVVVKLTEKPGAGYLWRVESIEGSIGQPQQTSEAASPAVGGPRTAVFTWATAGKPGTHKIALKLSRGATGEAAETFKVTLQVESGARTCPSQTSVNCMPPRRPEVASLCDADFREWAQTNCQVRYLD